MTRRTIGRHQETQIQGLDKSNQSLSFDCLPAPFPYLQLDVKLLMQFFVKIEKGLTKAKIGLSAFKRNVGDVGNLQSGQWF